jgi:hypothetical protein
MLVLVVGQQGQSECMKPQLSVCQSCKLCLVASSRLQKSWQKFFFYLRQYFCCDHHHPILENLANISNEEWLGGGNYKFDLGISEPLGNVLPGAPPLISYLQVKWKPRNPSRIKKWTGSSHVDKRVFNC